MQVRICDRCGKHIQGENGPWIEGAGVCPECGDELCEECAKWNGHDECARCSIDSATVARKIGIETIINQLDLRAWLPEEMNDTVLPDATYREIALHAIIQNYEAARQELESGNSKPGPETIVAQALQVSGDVFCLDCWREDDDGTDIAVSVKAKDAAALACCHCGKSILDKVMNPEAVIIIEGGVIQYLVSDREMDVLIADLDVEGAQPGDDLYRSPAGFPVFIGMATVAKNKFVLEHYKKQFNGQPAKAQ